MYRHALICVYWFCYFRMLYQCGNNPNSRNTIPIMNFIQDLLLVMHLDSTTRRLISIWWSTCWVVNIYIFQIKLYLSWWLLSEITPNKFVVNIWTITITIMKEFSTLVKYMGWWWLFCVKCRQVVKTTSWWEFHSTNII